MNFALRDAFTDESVNPRNLKLPQKSQTWYKKRLPIGLTGIRCTLGFLQTLSHYKLHFPAI